MLPTLFQLKLYLNVLLLPRQIEFGTIIIYIRYKNIFHQKKKTIRSSIKLQIYFYYKKLFLNTLPAQVLMRECNLVCVAG